MSMRAGGSPRSMANLMSECEGCQSGDSRVPRSGDFFAGGLFDVSARAPRSSASTRRTPSPTLPPRAKWSYNSRAIGVLGGGSGSNLSSCDIPFVLAPAFTLGIANSKTVRKVEAVGGGRRQRLNDLAGFGIVWGERWFERNLVAPSDPVFAIAPRVEFKIGAADEALDAIVNFIGLAAVLHDRRDDELPNIGIEALRVAARREPAIFRVSACPIALAHMPVGI